MSSEHPTNPAPSLSPTNAPTWPPLSSNREAGTRWAERLFRQASSASADVARFAAGL